MFKSVRFSLYNDFAYMYNEAAETIFKFIAYQEWLEGTGPVKPGNRGKQRCQIRQETERGDLKDEERLYKSVRLPFGEGVFFLERH